MEFWVGLSVGMHLGKVIADYLEKIVQAYGLLAPSTVEKIKQVEVVEEEISSVAKGMVD